ncbi:MAG: AAA family ATPase [Leptonema illini]|uniref:AAA family ATPase n=1 Tax=Leptonema illini TaxID=183 RepID=A0A833GYQ1_9LEPT|nr:MAG: AAA family ATPase [Leptonema illini]
MSNDRITQIHIAGLRSLADVTLDLSGLQVLIGDNGTGKSSILEALQILSQCMTPGAFVNDVIVRAHGGLESLLRKGSKNLHIAVKIEGDGPSLEYGFILEFIGNSPAVTEEYANRFGDSGLFPVLTRNASKTLFFRSLLREAIHKAIDQGEEVPPNFPLGNQSLLLPSVAPMGDPSLKRIAEALTNIKVHVPFETRALWQQKELNITAGPRWPDTIDQSDSLSRYALNLANVYHHLRNQGGEVWQRVITTARFGLGSDLRDIQLTAAGRGKIELQALYGGALNSSLPAEAFSDGQIAFLAFIALTELANGNSLITFDEPELHLHPALLARVVWMLEEVGSKTPVIISTHSDRLLDALTDPARSVVLCELDDQWATHLRRLDKEKLHQWFEDYRGFGSLRAEGYERHVLRDSDDAMKVQHP